MLLFFAVDLQFAKYLKNKSVKHNTFYQIQMNVLGINHPLLTRAAYFSTWWIFWLFLLNRLSCFTFKDIYSKDGELAKTQEHQDKCSVNCWAISQRPLLETDVYVWAAVTLNKVIGNSSIIIIVIIRTWRDILGLFVGWITRKTVDICFYGIFVYKTPFYYQEVMCWCLVWVQSKHFKQQFHYTTKEAYFTAQISFCCDECLLSE